MNSTEGNGNSRSCFRTGAQSKVRIDSAHMGGAPAPTSSQAQEGKSERRQRRDRGSMGSEAITQSK